MTDVIKSIAAEEVAFEHLKKMGAHFLTSEEVKQKMTGST